MSFHSEKNVISVWNNGKGIPIEMHQEQKVYVPTLIFGQLLTSSNYDDSQKKVTGGRNGFGAKLCNIYSKKFSIETACGEYGKKFKQVGFRAILLRYHNGLSLHAHPAKYADHKTKIL